MEKHEKPRLSLGSIINLSMGFLGIQMGFGLQNGNASRILANFGADVHELSYFWIVAPLTGLIVQPIIGHMGDNTWTRLGRRKPYFLAGAILASLGLIFLPNSNIIAGDGLSAAEFMGISAILWIGVAFLALMDASFNISMEPFRALVGDVLPKSQGTIGFSVQTILIGFGAILGSFLPWILTNWFGVSNVAPEGTVAPNVVWSFYVGAMILMATILYTIATVKEYSPEDYKRFAEAEGAEFKQENKGLVKAIIEDAKDMPMRMKKLGWVQIFSWFGLFTMWVYTTVGISQNAYDVEVGEQEISIALSALTTNTEIDREKVDETVEKINKINPKDGKYFVSSSLASTLGNDVIYPSEDLRAEIEILIRASTDVKAKEILGNEKNLDGDKLILTNEVMGFAFKNLSFQPEKKAALAFKYANAQHGEAGDWTGVLFTVYNLVATIFAFFITMIANRTSRKFVHIISLTAGGIGLMSMYFITDPQYLLISMVGVGLAWASILSVPYALLVDSLPPEKMGIYMGIFNFFIVFPQIINALIGGWIIHSFFADYAIYYVVFGGVLFILAALFTLRIREPLFKRKDFERA